MTAKQLYWLIAYSFPCFIPLSAMARAEATTAECAELSDDHSVPAATELNCTALATSSSGTHFSYGFHLSQATLYHPSGVLCPMPRRQQAFIHMVTKRASERIVDGEKPAYESLNSGQQKTHIYSIRSAQKELKLVVTGVPSPFVAEGATYQIIHGVGNEVLEIVPDCRVVTLK